MKNTNSSNAYGFIFQNDRLIIQTANDNPLLFSHDLQEHFLRYFEIGNFNTFTCYCAELNSDFVLPQQLQSIPLRRAFEVLSLDWYGAAVKAYSVIHWDKNHQYCGACSHETIHNPGAFERQCPECGLIVYPRISPSVVVLIHKDENILMARSPHFPPGAYGLIAGFVEPGENLEEAVHREVLEETNIRIKNLRYFSSQPWPFPDSLMVGFIAEHASGKLKIDPKEIEAAGWYPYDNLPGRPSTRISLSSKLLDYFIHQHAKKPL
jgi:NAD+ diphosphatase